MPVFASRLTSSTFVSTGIDFFSFCKPSLGPTSMIRTLSAASVRVLEKLRLGSFKVDCLLKRHREEMGRMIRSSAASFPHW